MGERGTLGLGLPAGHLRDQAIRLVASHEGLWPQIYLSLHLLPRGGAPRPFGDDSLSSVPETGDKVEGTEKFESREPSHG